MNRTGWLVFGVVVVAVVLCGCLAIALLIPGWFSTTTGVYGPGMGRMFDHCPWCGSGGVFGSIGTGEILVIALVLVLLAALAVGAVLLVVWLVRSSSSKRQEDGGEEG